MTRISIVSSWLCSTGVAVISGYCILTHHANTPVEQKKAAEVATRIAKRGLIPEYKPKNRHSSAVRKATVAKVTAKDVKVPAYVANNSNVNYYTVRPKVTVAQIKNKVVY